MPPCGEFLKLGVPFGGPHNQDYTFLGSMLGLFRETTMSSAQTSDPDVNAKAQNSSSLTLHSSQMLCHSRALSQPLITSASSRNRNEASFSKALSGKGFDRIRTFVSQRGKERPKDPNSPM